MKRIFLFLAMLLVFGVSASWAQLAPPPSRTLHYVKENYQTATNAAFYSCKFSVFQTRVSNEATTLFVRNLSATDTLFVGLRYTSGTNVDTTAPYYARVFPSETRVFTRVPIDSVFIKSTGASTSLYYGSQVDFIK